MQPKEKFSDCDKRIRGKHFCLGYFLTQTECFNLNTGLDKDNLPNSNNSKEEILKRFKPCVMKSTD